MTIPSLLVYAAISGVTKSLAKEGIKKNRKNIAQGYNFRGIDDVYNSLSSILPEHGLVILPVVRLRECTERTGKNGSVIFVVNVMVDFKFVSVNDGSTHTITMCGEAMDSSDKATNKAISAAYKYCCLTTFCIPTEGDNDADSSHIELKEIEIDYEKEAQELKELKEKSINKLKIKEEVKTFTEEIEDRFITSNEFEQIIEGADKAGTSIKKICDSLGITELGQMKLMHFIPVIAKLETMITKKETK